MTYRVDGRLAHGRVAPVDGRAPHGELLVGALGRAHDPGRGTWAELLFHLFIHTTSNILSSNYKAFYIHVLAGIRTRTHSAADH